MIKRKSNQAPAVIDDTLPGGARWMHNLGDEPVWVETKTQLTAELASRGLVIDERRASAKRDDSPWATRGRLKPGARDPFVHAASGPVSEALSAPRSDDRLPASTQTPQRGRGTLGGAHGPSGGAGTPERTIGSLGGDNGPSGTAGTDETPAEVFQLSLDQMRVVREYARFITDANLESWLFCGHCVEAYDTANRCLVSVELDTIFVVCRHALRFGNGATALSPRIAMPAPSTIAIDLFIAPEVRWSASVASLFRRYDREVLVPLSLKEALHCTTCFDHDRPDGCRAHVTGSELLVECRCQRRTFTGVIA